MRVFGRLTETTFMETNSSTKKGVATRVSSNKFKCITIHTIIHSSALLTYGNFYYINVNDGVRVQISYYPACSLKRNIHIEFIC